MLRLFAAFTLFFINLYACKGGYNSCKHKIKDSHALTNLQTNIPVTKHKRIVFSRTKPKGKILKYDPFLSLYLVEDKKGFRYPFQMRNRAVMGVASVDRKRAFEGRFKNHQIGLNQFAIFNQPVTVPALLLTSCCSLEGIVTPKGIIEKAYIERFLKIKKVSYSDIGIRVEDKQRKVLVKAINPFMDGNNFLVGDQILQFDNKRVTNAAKLMQWILFSKIGSTHKVKINRNGKKITLRMQSKKRNGGGYLSDTFLEVLGISFDKQLKIINIQAKAKKYGLKLGDKLLEVNHKKITTEGEIVKRISQSKEAAELLFERHAFQFFVKVKSI